MSDDSAASAAAAASAASAPAATEAQDEVRVTGEWQCTAPTKGLVSFHHVASCVVCHCLRPDPVFCSAAHAHCRQCASVAGNECTRCTGKLTSSPVWRGVYDVLKHDCCTPEALQCKPCGGIWFYNHSAIDYHAFECLGRDMIIENYAAPGEAIAIPAQAIADRRLEDGLPRDDIRVMYTTDPPKAQSRGNTSARLWVASPKHRWVVERMPDGFMRTIAAWRNTVIKVTVVSRSRLPNKQDRMVLAAHSVYFAVPCTPLAELVPLYGVDVKAARDMVARPGAYLMFRTEQPADIKELPVLQHTCVLRMCTPATAVGYRDFYTHCGVRLHRIIPTKALERGEKTITTYWKNKRTGFRFITSYTRGRKLIYVCYLCGAETHDIRAFLSYLCAGLVTAEELMESEVLSDKLDKVVSASMPWSEPGKLNHCFRDFYDHISKSVSDPDTTSATADMRRARFLTLVNRVSEDMHKPKPVASGAFRCTEDMHEFVHQQRHLTNPHMKSMAELVKRDAEAISRLVDTKRASAAKRLAFQEHRDRKWAEAGGGFRNKAPDDVPDGELGRSISANLNGHSAKRSRSSPHNPASRHSSLPTSSSSHRSHSSYRTLSSHRRSSSSSNPSNRRSSSSHHPSHPSHRRNSHHFSCGPRRSSPAPNQQPTNHRPFEDSTFAYMPSSPTPSPKT